MSNVPEKSGDFRAFLGSKIEPFVFEVIQFTKLLRTDAKYIPIANQLLRSSTSIGANFHESRGCSSRKEYARYFEHSYKSTCETTYWLRLSSELEDRFINAKALEKRSVEIERILHTSIAKLRQPFQEH
jgi:four helix bundle protein